VSNTNGVPVSFRITVNPDFLVHSNDASSQAVIVIPPSSSDLSESAMSAATAPSSFNINLNLGCPVTATFNETFNEITIVPSASSDSETNEPQQFKSSASFADLIDKGVDFEEQDDYDRIRVSSSGMSLQYNDPRLRIDHHRSFGSTIDKVEWFRGGKRPCPRGGWLTRMTKEDDSHLSLGETGTPVSGMYRTSNGFTFQI
jgi:hypothetical protein